LYDFVFVTHLPSFYKVNLYNEIAKKKKIYVLYIGTSSAIRTKDFCSSDMNFDFSYLYDNTFESTNKFVSFQKIMKFLQNIKYTKIILGGWDVLELWMFAFLSPKRKNYTVIESSIYESKVSGIYLFLKKVYQSRMSGVYVSGKPQKQLAEVIGYKNIISTGGVGLFNKVIFQKSTKKYEKKFLYVGRLSEEKNLFSIIDVFKKIDDASLEIVGNGPLKEQIKKEIENSQNIMLIQHINNSEIHNKYLENDIFILPSKKEPWGLVVEEALYYGLPVIASSQVGSKDDMIVQFDSGKVFDINDKNSLVEVVDFFLIEENYQKMKNNVMKIDFDQLFENQVNSYIL